MPELAPSRLETKWTWQSSGCPLGTAMQWFSTTCHEYADGGSAPSSPSVAVPLKAIGEPTAQWLSATGRSIVATGALRPGRMVTVSTSRLPSASVTSTRTTTSSVSA